MFVRLSVCRSRLFSNINFRAKGVYSKNSTETAYDADNVRFDPFAREPTQFQPIDLNWSRCYKCYVPFFDCIHSRSESSRRFILRKKRFFDVFLNFHFQRSSTIITSERLIARSKRPSTRIFIWQKLATTRRKCAIRPGKWGGASYSFPQYYMCNQNIHELSW